MWAFLVVFWGKKRAQKKTDTECPFFSVSETVVGLKGIPEQVEAGGQSSGFNWVPWIVILQMAFRYVPNSHFSLALAEASQAKQFVMQSKL